MSVWWNTAIFGVIVGGLIVTATQMVLHILANRTASSSHEAVLRGASRALRDDLRAIEARMAIAIRDGEWWGDEDSVPPLHTPEDVRHIAAAVTDPKCWGHVAIARRTALRIEAHRKAGREFLPLRLAKEFWTLEKGREILALDIEGLTLDEIEWAKEVRKVYPRPEWSAHQPHGVRRPHRRRARRRPRTAALESGDDS